MSRLAEREGRGFALGGFPELKPKIFERNETFYYLQSHLVVGFGSHTKILQCTIVLHEQRWKQLMKIMVPGWNISGT